MMDGLAKAVPLRKSFCFGCERTITGDPIKTNGVEYCSELCMNKKENDRREFLRHIQIAKRKIAEISE